MPRVWLIFVFNSFVSNIDLDLHTLHTTVWPGVLQPNPTVHCPPSTSCHHSSSLDLLSDNDFSFLSSDLSAGPGFLDSSQKSVDDSGRSRWLWSQLWSEATVKDHRSRAGRRSCPRENRWEFPRHYRRILHFKLYVFLANNNLICYILLYLANVPPFLCLLLSTLLTLSLLSSSL